MGGTRRLEESPRHELCNHSRTPHARHRSRDRTSRRPQGPRRGRWGGRRTRRDQRRDTSGSFTAIMGPSGSGRDTFLHVAAGLDRPTSGTVALGDTDLAGLSERRLTILRRERIGFIFQAFNLMPSLTVTQNIGLPLRLDRGRPRRAEVRAVAARVGLDERLRHRPAQLSAASSSGSRSPGAEAAAARCLRLADQLTAGAADIRTGGGVLALLREVVDVDGHTVVMVTHDPVGPRRTPTASSSSPTGGSPGCSTLPTPTRSPSSSRTWGTDRCFVSLFLSARGRLGTFTGAFVALFASAALMMAGGMPFEAALRTQPPVERYADAAAVVTGQQVVGGEDKVPLSERARVDSALAARLAAVPGVRAAIADVSAPAQLGGRPTVAHGWSSAKLTPYVLRAGRAPARADEVVTGYRAALGSEAAPRGPPRQPAPSPSSASLAPATRSGSGRRSSSPTPRRRGWPVIQAASTRSAYSPAPASTRRASAPRAAARWCSPGTIAARPSIPTSRRRERR